MADKEFALVPEKVPTRTRNSKYASAVQEFISSGQESSKITLHTTKLETAYQGFHKVIKSKYDGEVELTRVNGTLFIKKA